MDPLRLQYYMFDWDDNILFMPTVLHYVQRMDDGTGRPIPITTGQLALDDARPEAEKVYPKGKYEAPVDAFREFTDAGGDFVGDAKRAIAYKGFGPSFKAFKAALCEGALFAIVSARGHAPETVKEGVRALIFNAMTIDERATMRRSIAAWFERAGQTVPADDDLIDAYLDGPNGYFGVAYRHDGEKVDIPKLKMVAIEKFVKDALEGAHEIKADGQDVSVRFGFSDDDRHNIEGMKDAEFFRRLDNTYEGVSFFVYGYNDDETWECSQVLKNGTWETQQS